MKTIRSRKILIIALAFVVVLACSIGATIAYLTDEDSAVNVMTIGRVKIVQQEQQREQDDDGRWTGELEDFEDDRLLMPAVYEGEALPYEDPTDGITVNGNTFTNVYGPASGALDKIVNVRNTGTVPCYVRTIIAFQTFFDDGMFPDSDFTDKVHAELNTGVSYDPAAEDSVFINIDGIDYKVVCAIYEAPVEAGAETDPSLIAVYFDKTVTSEMMDKLAAQGGDSYSILCLSQAVQSQGFADAETALNEAFGEVTAENAAAWLAETAVP